MYLYKIIEIAPYECIGDIVVTHDKKFTDREFIKLCDEAQKEVKKWDRLFVTEPEKMAEYLEKYGFERAQYQASYSF